MKQSSYQSQSMFYSSEFSIVIFLQGVVEIRCFMFFSLIKNHVRSFHSDLATVFQSERITDLLYLIVAHKYTLKGFRIHSESCHPLKTLLIPIQVDIFELIKWHFSGHINGLRDTAVAPFLSRCLNVHMGIRGYVFRCTKGIRYFFITC